MKRRAPHGSDVADIRGDCFIGYRIRRVQVANEVTVFCDEIGTEHQRITRWNVKNGGIISNGDGCRRFESLPDLAYQAAFAEILKLHTMASAVLRRRGPRTIFGGLFSRSAALKTLW